MMNQRTSNLKRVVLASACIGGVALGAENCVPLAERSKATLSAYVQQKHMLPATSVVRVSEDTALPDCYHKLRFVSDTTNPAFSILLYLTPDQRYLTPELFDSRSDPIAEQRRTNLAVQDVLTKGNLPSQGPAAAPVTIVEFSDFECPYCRQASQLIRDLIAGPDRKNIRLVFRHFPLKMHPWARAAAEGAACAKFQSAEAFWKIHDALFENQAAINADNVQAKLLESVQSVSGLDVGAYQSCVDNALSVGAVLKDIDAGVANSVRARRLCSSTAGGWQVFGTPRSYEPSSNKRWRRATQGRRLRPGPVSSKTVAPARTRAAE